MHFKFFGRDIVLPNYVVYSICGCVSGVLILGLVTAYASLTKLPSASQEAIELAAVEYEELTPILWNDTTYSDVLLSSDGSQSNSVIPLNPTIENLLIALANAIHLEKFNDAQKLIPLLQGKATNKSQELELKFRQAQIAFFLEKHEDVVDLLTEPAKTTDANTNVDDTLPLFPIQRKDVVTLRDVLILLMKSQEILELEQDLVATLIQLDPLLPKDERIVNQARILKLMESFDSLSFQLLKENFNHESIAGWNALSEILRIESVDERAQEVQSWRDQYVSHPAEQQLLKQYLSLEEPSDDSKEIVMLLPITSTFGKAAQAFYEGFMASRNADKRIDKPMVSVQDIGENPRLVPVHYRNAVGDGASFIVGPLGRKAVDTLISSVRPTVRTLVIGNIPERRVSSNLYGISLSPEPDARQAAQRAFSAGHRYAGIVRNDTEWGERVATAFAEEWELLGGQIVDNHSIAPEISDYSLPIQQLFGLNKSAARKISLELELDLDLEFTPRRREDFDFIFFATNAEQAQLLVPQIKFFQGHDLDLYAISNMYGGKPNPATDADLDGIMFGDMRWVLDVAILPEQETSEPTLKSKFNAGSENRFTNTILRTEIASRLLTYTPAVTPITTERIATIEQITAAPISSRLIRSTPVNPVTGPRTAAPSATPKISKKITAVLANTPISSLLARIKGRASNPYHHTALDRLYALGLESYQLIPTLPTLRENPNRRHFGKAMDISIQSDGNAQRHLTWAKFTDGLPVIAKRNKFYSPRAISAPSNTNTFRYDNSNR